MAGPSDQNTLERLNEVRAQIAVAADAARRTPDDIELVAVSKKFDADAITPLLAAGHRVFGENRVQEALDKWPALKRNWPDIELHLIGPLQTNKAKQAVGLFDCIETVDRPKLARTLASLRDSGLALPELMVQVNTGGEAQKAGIPPEEVDGFLDLCRGEHKLEISGLMCIPPIDEEPALHFALLEKIAKRNNLAKLSMGMSGDYQKAVALGATHIRLGTAVFGPRP